MPVYAADVLPDTTGRNLGSPSQRWNIFANNLDTGGSSGVIYVATAPGTANANSTAGQLLLTCTIPAGTLNALGKVLRVTAGGTYTIQAGQTPNFGFGLTLGSLGLVTSYELSPPITNPAGAWRVQAEMTVYVPGSTAQIDPHGILMLGGFVSVANTSGPVGPADLTINQELSCACLFATNTSPAHVCTQYQFIVEVLN